MLHAHPFFMLVYVLNRMVIGHVIHRCFAKTFLVWGSRGSSKEKEPSLEKEYDTNDLGLIVHTKEDNCCIQKVRSSKY